MGLTTLFIRPDDPIRPGTALDQGVMIGAVLSIFLIAWMFYAGKTAKPRDPINYVMGDARADAQLAFERNDTRYLAVISPSPEVLLPPGVILPEKHPLDPDRDLRQVALVPDSDDPTQMWVRQSRYLTLYNGTMAGMLRNYPSKRRPKPRPIGDHRVAMTLVTALPVALLLYLRYLYGFAVQRSWLWDLFWSCSSGGSLRHRFIPAPFGDEGGNLAFAMWGIFLFYPLWVYCFYARYFLGPQP